MSAEKLAERGQQSSRLRTVPSEELAARCGTLLCGDRRVEPADEAFVDDTHIHMIESCATWIPAFRASDSFNAASDCDLCESRGIDFEAVNLQDSWGGPVGVRKSYDHLGAAMRQEFSGHNIYTMSWTTESLEQLPDQSSFDGGIWTSQLVTVDHFTGALLGRLEHAHSRDDTDWFEIGGRPAVVEEYEMNADGTDRLDRYGARIPVYVVLWVSPRQ